jgi:integrase
MAHLILAYMSKLSNWHAGRHDDFRSPIVRGMGRINAKERARSRVLSDDELRAVWSAAEGSPSRFDRYAQFLLLTGCRRTEAARMTKTELAGADWLIPGSRTKSKVDHLLPLSQAALHILESLPRVGPPNGFLFTHDGDRSFGNFTRDKGDLQKRSNTTGWSIHDLKRTAHTLMTRAVFHRTTRSAR